MVPDRSSLRTRSWTVDAARPTASPIWANVPLASSWRARRMARSLSSIVPKIIRPGPEEFRFRRLLAEQYGHRLSLSLDPFTLATGPGRREEARIDPDRGYDPRPEPGPTRAPGGPRARRGAAVPVPPGAGVRRARLAPPPWLPRGHDRTVGERPVA